MTSESEGLRIARYVNVGLWFWLLASDALNPVVTDGDFWGEKLRQAFSVNSNIFNGPRIAGNAVAILVFWFAVDLFLRWLWRLRRGGQQRADRRRVAAKQG
jgi:hypothetical protein